MSKLILGTVQFGLNYGINNSEGKPVYEKAKAILNFAYDHEIKELDTADAYGDSQDVIKKYLGDDGKQFNIMSKFIWDRQLDFDQHLESSLKQLNVASLKGYYFHRYSDFFEFKYFNQIEAALKNNKIKYAGVSVYSNEELKAAINSPVINLIQVPFNLLDNNKVKQELLKTASERGVLIYVRSAFLQGLFFKDVNELPAKFLVLKSYLKKLNEIALDFCLSMEELCLAYLKSKNFIDGILIGVDSIDQLDRNIKCFSKNITDEQVQMIEQIKIDQVELLNPANWN